MSKLLATEQKKRIVTLDVLRGFALLGILIMNIVGFSMIGAHYSNPFAEGPLNNLDELAFLFGQLFANQKFMSIFSMLFGAGIVLMSEKVDAQHGNPTRRHYTRNFWLFIIGLLHLLLLWSGDILMQYALCSFWVFWLRKKKPLTLFVVGGLFLLLSVFISFAMGLLLPEFQQADLMNMKQSWQPNAELIEKEKTLFLGSWLHQVVHRFQELISDGLFIFLTNTFWHISGLMIIGIGLYKTGVFSGVRNKRFYLVMAVLGIGLGVALTVHSIIKNYEYDWSIWYTLFFGSQYAMMGSLPMALGYVATVNLLFKSRLGSWLEKWLAPVGQMALTNYLLQSLLACFLFYGFGLGLFGSVGRAAQLPIVFIIWLVQILISRWWLQHFSYGPIEWAWRSLTYGRVMVMRKMRF